MAAQNHWDVGDIHEARAGLDANGGARITLVMKDGGVLTGRLTTPATKAMHRDFLYMGRDLFGALPKLLAARLVSRLSKPKRRPERPDDLTGT